MADWKREDLRGTWSDDFLAAFFTDALIRPKRDPQADTLSSSVSAVLARNGFLEGEYDLDENRTQLSARLRELAWRWVVLGILVPQDSAFALTPSGRQALKSSNPDARVPLVRGGLAQTLKERCPAIDEVAYQYAELAHEEFVAGHMEATVLLLGGASETITSNLVVAINQKASLLAVPQISVRTAKQRLEELRDFFDSNEKVVKRAIKGAGGTANWVGELPMLLGGANAIRLTRNSAGHPKEIRALQFEAHGLIVMFPQLAEAVVTTTDEIDSIT